MQPGGTFISKRVMSPDVTASRCRQIASSAQPHFNSVVGSRTCHALFANAARERLHSSLSALSRSCSVSFRLKPRVFRDCHLNRLCFGVILTVFCADWPGLPASQKIARTHQAQTQPESARHLTPAAYWCSPPCHCTHGCAAPAC